MCSAISKTVERGTLLAWIIVGLKSQYVSILINSCGVVDHTPNRVLNHSGGVCSWFHLFLCFLFLSLLVILEKGSIFPCFSTKAKSSGRLIRHFLSCFQI